MIEFMSAINLLNRHTIFASPLLAAVNQTVLPSPSRTPSATLSNGHQKWFGLAITQTRNRNSQFTTASKHYTFNLIWITAVALPPKK